MQELAVIEGFHLSPQQRHAWQREERVGPCRGRCAVWVEGPVDTLCLQSALEGISKRHETLRTRFEHLPGMEVPIQVIADETTVSVTRETLHVGKDLSCEEQVEECLRHFSALPAGGPSAGRVSLAPISSQRHVVWIDLPSTCADRQSLFQLLHELRRDVDRLRCGAKDPGEEPLQYVQYSEWQNELLEGEEAEEGNAFWQSALEDLPAATCLGAPRGPAESRKSARLSKALEPGSGQLLAALAKRHGTEPRWVLLVLWQLLLAKLSGESRIAVETRFDGRRFPELKETLGPFERYLPVPLEVSEKTPLPRLLKRVSLFVDQAYQWQEFYVPDPALCPATFGFDAYEWPEEKVEGALRWRLLDCSSDLDRFQLHMAVVDRGDLTEVRLRYAPERFERRFVEQLAERFQALLTSALARPAAPVGELCYLGPAERERLVVEWNRTECPVPEATVHGLFEAQAAKTPAAPALVFDGEELSYAELNRAANRLAHRLQHLGVGPEDRVALCLERSAALYGAALGVLKAGGGFVALDPEQPRERLRFILAQSAAKVVVVHSSSREAAAQAGAAVVLDVAELRGEGDHNPGSAAGPDALAYTLFTSGSTGRPKGVMVRHRSLVNLVQALDEAAYQGLGEGLRVSVNAPLSFDASIKQWIQLTRGHTLYPVPEALRPDGEALLDFLVTNRIDVFDCTPAQLRLLLAAGLAEQPAGVLSLVLVGGEAIDAELWAELTADRRRCYVNVYGPTECTVDTTACRVTASSPRPALGRPLANVRTHVLDRRSRLVPEGVSGELHVAGAGVARGYLERPALSAEYFVPDSLSAAPGSRRYRTGDRVRHLPGGGLEFLGRVDHQVKLRGFRIELGEVESVLREHPGVADAAATVREDEPGDRRLVAYVAPPRRWLSEAGGPHRYRLPNGMAIAHQNRNETEYLYREIFENRCYAQHGIRLREDAVVFDVGANIGMFSLFVARHRPRARIFAFEPLPPLFGVLEQNTELYVKGARLFPWGLSDRAREERFTFYPRYTMMSGQSSYADADSEVEVVKRFLENEQARGVSEAALLLEEADELLAGRFEGESHTVRLRRLSEIIAEESVERIDLLKVDVQRAELDVLLGLTAGDWEKVDQVVMEVHDAPGEGTAGRIGILRELLESRGFTVIFEQDVLLEGTDRYNLYALRPERVRGAELDSEPEAARDAGVGELDASELRDLVREHLPASMVPAAIVVLDEIPLNRRGKVDRAALPAPEELALGEQDLAPARTPFEEVLQAIFSEVLGTERVAVDANFFDLGGHSLIATQLMSRLREVFGVEMALRTLFEAPSVEALANRIEVEIGSGGESPAPALEPVPRQEEMPLSFAEQRLWFLQQLEPESTSYNSSKAVRLEGTLDVAAFASTLTQVVRRHEILRTTFPVRDGQPVQRIAPPAAFPLPIVDLSRLGEPVRKRIAQQRIDQEARRAFDLERGPLMSALLIRFDSTHHVVLLRMHHIVSDAWSVGLLVREVAALYEAFSQGKPSPLAELPIQYADFSSWQRRWLDGEVFERQMHYWRRQLSGKLPILKLPTDRPRSARVTNRGQRRIFQLAPELSPALRELGRREGTTLFMTLLAAFQVLLSRYSGQDDVVVGVPIAGRNRKETESLIGFFINMLMMRTDLVGNPTFREILTRVRHVALGAYAHQDLPFDKLVEEFQPQRSSNGAPVVEVTIGLQNVPRESFDMPGLTLRSMSLDFESVRHELTLWMFEQEEALEAAWTYSTELFNPETIERIHAHFETVLRTVVAHPDVRLNDIEVLTEEEKAEHRRQTEDLKARNRKRFLAKKSPTT